MKKASETHSTSLSPPAEQAAVKRLLRADEVARVLAISPWRVYDLARRRLLPAVRIGRSIRFDPDAIAQLVEGGGFALGASADVANEHRAPSPEAAAKPSPEKGFLEPVCQQSAKPQGAS